METLIFEGTLAEMPKCLSRLTLKPETKLRILATIPISDPVQNVEAFQPTEFRNGLPLLPRRQISEPITIELVNRLSEDDYEDVWNAG